MDKEPKDKDHSKPAPAKAWEQEGIPKPTPKDPDPKQALDVPPPVPAAAPSRPTEPARRTLHGEAPPKATKDHALVGGHWPGTKDRTATTDAAVPPRRFRVTKTTGLSRVVVTDAERIEFCQGGSLAFWNGDLLVAIVYSPTEWQTVVEEDVPVEPKAPIDAATPAPVSDDQPVITARDREAVETTFGRPLVETPVDAIRGWIHRLADKVTEKGEQIGELTPEEEAFIANEWALSKIDFAYWAERYATINVAATRLGPMYPLWESQRLILAKIGDVERDHEDAGHPDGIFVNILKARQLGASTLAEAIVAHRTTTRADTIALIAADVPEQSGKTFQMYERNVRHLPWWLRPRITDDVKNTEMGFVTGSHVYLGSGKSTRGTTGERGDLGRGGTIAIFHLTELSRWEDAEQLDEAFFPSVAPVPQAFGILESTAKGFQDWWHKHWRRTTKGLGRCVNVFIPWYAEQTKYWLPYPAAWVPSVTTIAHARACEASSPRYFRGSTIRLTLEQLYWYERTRALFEEDDNLAGFLEEYPANEEDAFQFGGRSIFPISLQMKVRLEARPMIGALEVKANRELVTR